MEQFSFVIVENDSIIATDIESILINSGFNVTGNFTSGKILLQKIKDPYPDAAIIDIPIEDPFNEIETASKLSAQFNIPTIFLTALPDIQTLNRTIGSKPLDYIIKPFTEKDIIVTVKSALVRYNLEKELKESRLKYKMLFENMPEGCAVYRAADNGNDFIFLEFNRTAERINNLSRNDVIGKSIKTVFPGVKNFAILKTLKSVWISGKSEYTPIEEHAGKKTEGCCGNYIYKIPSGDIVAVYTNETAVKNIEDLEIAKVKAENSDKLKSMFLANMSHEIRTPLNSIIGFTDLVLSDKTLSETNREFLQNSKNSSNLLLNLINDILDLSKIEAGQIIISESKCLLTDLMDSVGKRANILIHGKMKHIEVRKYYQPEIAEYILCDSFRLEQILNNLIGNAAKFTESGYLEYGFSKKNDMLEFYVRDTGLGISQKEQERIFQPFIQADLNISIKYGGTGLGLAITKKLIEIMGGSINLVSQEQMGTTFYFTIPYKPVKGTKKKVTRKKFGKKTGIRKKKMKILVVEDDKVNQRLVEAILQKNNFSIVLSDNGMDAVSRYKTDRDIDLILMDLHLPLLDGLEATKRIRKIQKKEKRKNVPIIALTASAMKGDEDKFISSGCNAYLTKPLDMNTLIETISKFS